MTTKKKLAAKQATKRPIAKKRGASKAAVAEKPLARTVSKKLAEQKLRREIARRNKLFAAADNAGKRVLIAKDVIAQLKSGRFNAKQGLWLDFGSALSAKWDSEAWEHHQTLIKPSSAPPDTQRDAGVVLSENVREKFLAKKMPSCSCCALGSMFMSCTLFNNQTTVKQLHTASHELGDAIESPAQFAGDGVLSNGLLKFFSFAQLRLIEIAFEGDEGYFGSSAIENAGFNPPARGSLAALSWREKYPRAKARLRAIMQNIVDNNGTFKP